MANNPNVQIDKSMLERGYWLATHRLTIKRWGSIALYAIIGITYTTFFIQFGLYLFRYSDWNTLVAQAVPPTIDWRVAQANSGPKELQFGQPQLFSLGDNQYVFIVSVENPNRQWSMNSFTFSFVASDGTIVTGDPTYILPEEKKFVSVLGYQMELPISGIAEFEPAESTWLKITRLPPLSWEFTEVPTFHGKRVIVDGNKQVLLPANVTWSAKNSSTLTVKKLVWQIALFGGDRLVSLSELAAEDFPFLAERHFEVALPSINETVTRVTVTPLVNIFDPRSGDFQ